MNAASPWSGQVILKDGPFLKNTGAARRNAALLAWLSPLVVGPALAAWGLAAPIPWARAWVLAGGFLGALIFAPERRRTLLDLDWAVAAVLAGTLLTPPLGSGPGDAAGFTGGLAVGFLAARPRFAALLGRPGLIPLYVLVLSAFLGPLVSPESSTAPPLFGHIPPRDVLPLAMAGLGLAWRRTSAGYWIIPWLAWVAGVFLEPLIWSHFGAAGRFGLATVAVLLLPALFVAPRMARTKAEYGLALAGTIPALGLSLYFPRLFGFDLVPLYGLFLIVGPLWLKGKRRKLVAGQAAAVTPPGNQAKAYLRCGHRGRAPRLARWSGPPSCRLAADHDDGFLLCPYGCLGLGDCLRACPHGAITDPAGASADGAGQPAFPIIDMARCQGCGRCARICPRQLFTLETGAGRAFIPCASLSSLKKNADYCARGCLGCGRCRKACPAGAINRPGPSGALAVDQALCQAYGPDCGRACAQACPRRLFDGLSENTGAAGEGFTPE